MTRVRIAIAALGALLAAPLAAQQARGNDEIVVTGQKKEIAKALRQMIAPTDSEQLARFEDQICPMVIGMPRDWTAVLTRMIRDNVVKAGGKAAAPGCRVNAVAIFIDQPQELVQALAEAEPGFFTKTPRELDRFVATPRAAYSWHVTDMRDRDGGELASMGALIDPNSGARLPTDAKIVRSASAGRLISNVRDDMLAGYVVIDRQRTVGLTLRQLADFATLHLMLDVRPEAGASDADSILSLFEARAAGGAPPARMSRFDGGALRGFYSQRQNNRSAAQQRENIAAAMRRSAKQERDDQ